MPHLEPDRLHVLALVALLGAAAAPTAGAQVLSQPPSVEFTNPADGDVVRGTVNVTGEAEDPDAAGSVEEVQLRIDDGRWRTANGTSEWSMDWDTTLWESGNHTLTVRAEDDDGNTDNATINVTANQAPEIAIDRPRENVTVADQVTVQGTAGDPEGRIDAIEVRVDEGPWRNATGTTDWSFDWNTSDVREGNHTIAARVHDGGAEPAAHASVNVTVSNERENPPTVEIREPEPGASLEGTVDVEGVAHDPEGQLERVELRVDEGPWQTTRGTRDWSLAWDTTAVADGNHTLEVRASDPHGTATGTRDVTVDNVHASEVEIADPADGARVNGTVEVAGSADVEGEPVERVQVRIDEGPWREADGSANWTFEWDTRDVPDGSHRIEVRAEGENSNATEAVTVRVANGGERLAATAEDPEQQAGSPPDLSLEQAGRSEEVGEDGEVALAGVVEDADDEAVTIEYRIDQGSWRPLEVVAGERFQERIDVSDLDPGRHEVAVRASDGNGTSAVQTFTIEVEEPILGTPAPGPTALVLAALAAARVARRG